MPGSLFLLCQFHCTFYFVIAVTGLYIFPQIFIKGEFVWGSDITLEHAPGKLSTCFTWLLRLMYNLTSG
jgi:hypothetical protein